MKLDMSKAYDRVEWSFLRGVLLRLGFSHRFVALVMLLVTIVSYSITLNGDQFGYFCPERGISQGDPLPPYLFIFCAEVLSCLIQDAENRGRLTGVAVARNAPRVSHLLFADDTLVFCEATKEQINEWKHARGGKTILGRLVGSRLVPCHDKYLGLPAVGGRSRQVLFKNIRERFWDRIGRWNAKLLSQAGKGVLIKAVLQSLSTYAMSCFMLPVTLLRSLESTMADFWWHNRGEKWVYWIAWRKMCRPLREGVGVSGVQGV
ncbi:UNVERIFIED_CONTAM: putative mitochondrial protein [Sesamum latifolium]|uniref:Mitochondrial protein n=1 Tax=Sesamum latifolium TaxID=2727402 RepID=A0AAW2TSB7_9LAMI